MDRRLFAETNNTENVAKRTNRWVQSLAALVLLGLGGHSALANTKTSHHYKTATHVATHHTHAKTIHVAHQAEHVAHITAHHHVYVAGAGRHHTHTQYAAYSHRKFHNRYASAKYRHSYLQCVPYAREISHIQLSGDAFLWWAEASGRYARGNTPAEGAVLNFRPVGRMPLGHVAVVTSVIDSRTILTTQANWVRGTITNDVTMQDVSANNDWSEVEVELGDSAKWGAPYPVYGFIYNRPDYGTVIANNTAQGNEVAEAPRAVVVQADAPDRNLQ